MTLTPDSLLRLGTMPMALAAAMPLLAQQVREEVTLPGPAVSPVPDPSPSTTEEQPPPDPADTPAGVISPPQVVAPPTAVEARPSAPPVPVPTPSPPAAPPATATALAQPDLVEDTSAPAAPLAASAPSVALGKPVLDWRWLAAGAALMAALLGAILLRRRRKPKVLMLAAPAPVAEGDDKVSSDPPRINLALDITRATRSVMMFTLAYRLTLANRSARAVKDLGVGIQLASAQRGQSNAAPLAAARSLARVERIGPHQARTISGEVQLPIAAIAPVMQGRTPLFIPLVHVTIEGEGQPALAHSFVIGTPSAGAEGRVHPLPFEMAPGSVPGLKARPIATPAAAQAT